MDKAGGAKYQDDPNYLQTAGRTLEVLQLFLEGESLSLTAVARRMELSSTVVYRLLYTLTAHGFLIQDEDKSYRVGPARPTRPGRWPAAICGSFSARAAARSP